MQNNQADSNQESTGWLSLLCEQRIVPIVLLPIAQANQHFEKEKNDNPGFIAWNYWGQSSNRVVKSSYPHPSQNHILGALVGRSSPFFQFFLKIQGYMHKICLTKIIPHKIIY